MSEAENIYPEEKRVIELNNAFESVTKLIINDYYKQMDDILSFHKGKLLESEVLVLISKIINSCTVAMFFSFKDYLPEAPINYDILAENICKSIKGSFMQIGAYTSVKH